MLRHDDELLVYRYHPQATTFSINELVARRWREYIEKLMNVINQGETIVMQLYLHGLRNRYPRMLKIWMHGSGGG